MCTRVGWPDRVWNRGEYYMGRGGLGVSAWAKVTHYRDGQKLPLLPV
jgi:hypothetical protein